MDIALGVSMTPTTVRMVLVEGEKADGVTVDNDTFDIETGEGSATAADQVVAAILGTRESATEGGHRLVSTGVTWTDRAVAADLRDALKARKIDDVVLVSELHAAGALAQAVGQTVGYDRTALMLLDRDTATVAVVETASGAIVKVQTESLHAHDAVAELQGMIAGLEGLDQPPQGLFVLGSGVDVSAVKSQLSLGTTLPVHAPEEAELALARGAALASAASPRYEASTVGLGYARDPDGTTAGKAYPAGADTEMSAAGLAEAGTQMAAAGYMAPLGYSEVLDELDGDLGYDAIPADPDFTVDEPERKPFLLVGSSLASIFVIGVVALVISLAVSIRPTVNQRPNPAESVIVPSSQTPAAVVPEAAVPAPSPPSVPDTIQEPVPVVQQAPRTVYVTPAPQAPAPAPAAPAPAPEAPAPVPEAPAPAPIAPVIPPPIIAPPVIVLPPLLPPFLRPPRAPHYPSYPSSPSYPSYPSSPPSQPSSPPSQPSEPTQPSQPSSPSQPSYPTQNPSQPSYPSSPSSPVVTEAPSAPSAAGGSGGYGSGGGGYGSGGSSSSSGSEGSRSTDSGGSGSSGRGSGSSPLWPFPSFGH